jgi:hypothetical protein
MFMFIWVAYWTQNLLFMFVAHKTFPFCFACIGIHLDLNSMKEVYNS